MKRELREAIEWLERSRDSKSPSMAQYHAKALLAHIDRLEKKLAKVTAERDIYHERVIDLGGHGRG